MAKQQQPREDDGRYKHVIPHATVPTAAPDSPSAATAKAQEAVEDGSGIANMTYEIFQKILPNSQSMFSDDVTLSAE